MHGRNLRDHWQAKLRTLPAAARGLHPVKPLPDALLLVFRDSWAVVKDRQGDVLPLAPHLDRDTRSTIAVGVLQQILQRACDQRHVEPRRDPWLQPGLNRAFGVYRALLLSDHLGQIAEVGFFEAKRHGALFQARHL